MKTCSKCKEDKQLNAFACTQKKDGTKRYSSWCKSCVNARLRAKRKEQGKPSREEWLDSVRKPKLSKQERKALGKAKWDAWYAEQGENMRLNKMADEEKKRQALLAKGVKCCSTCKEELPLSQFTVVNRKRRDGSSYESFKSECKTCKNNKAVKYRASPEGKARDTSYRKSPEGKARAKRQDALRRKRSKKATPKWLTQEQKQQIVDTYEHMRDCRAVTGEDYHVDHIVPLRGEGICGLHVPWNLQVLPAYVNLAKSNTHYEDPPMDQQKA